MVADEEEEQMQRLQQLQKIDFESDDMGTHNNTNTHQQMDAALQNFNDDEMPSGEEDDQEDYDQMDEELEEQQLAQLAIEEEQHNALNESPPQNNQSLELSGQVNINISSDVINDNAKRQVVMNHQKVDYRKVIDQFQTQKEPINYFEMSPNVIGKGQFRGNLRKLRPTGLQLVSHGSPGSLGNKLSQQRVVIETHAKHVRPQTGKQPIKTTWQVNKSLNNGANQAFGNLQETHQNKTTQFSAYLTKHQPVIRGLQQRTRGAFTIPNSSLLLTPNSLTDPYITQIKDTQKMLQENQLQKRQSTAKLSAESSQNRPLSQKSRGIAISPGRVLSNDGRRQIRQKNAEELTASQTKQFNEPEKLKENIAALREDNTKLEKQNMQLNTKISFLKKELKEREKMIDEFIQNGTLFSHASVAVGSPQNRTIVFSQQRETVLNFKLKHKMRELEDIIKQRDEEVELLKKNLKQTRLEEKEAELTEVYKEAKRLRKMLDECEQTITKQNEQRTKLKEKIKKLRTTIKTQNIDSLIQQINPLNSFQQITQTSQMAQHTKQIYHSQQQSPPRQGKPISPNQSLISTSQCLEVLHQQLADLKKQNENLQSRLTHLTTENKRLSKSLLQTQEELKQKGKESADNHQWALMKQRQTLAEAEKARQLIQDRFEEALIKAERWEKEVEKHRQITADYQDKCSRIDDLELEKYKLEEEIKRLKQKLIEEAEKYERMIKEAKEQKIQKDKETINKQLDIKNDIIPLETKTAIDKMIWILKLNNIEKEDIKNYLFDKVTKEGEDYTVYELSQILISKFNCLTRPESLRLLRYFIGLPSEGVNESYDLLQIVNNNILIDALQSKLPEYTIVSDQELHMNLTKIRELTSKHKVKAEELEATLQMYDQDECGAISIQDLKEGLITHSLVSEDGNESVVSEKRFQSLVIHLLKLNLTSNLDLQIKDIIEQLYPTIETIVLEEQVQSNIVLHSKTAKNHQLEEELSHFDYKTAPQLSMTAHTHPKFPPQILIQAASGSTHTDIVHNFEYCNSDIKVDDLVQEGLTSNNSSGGGGRATQQQQQQMQVVRPLQISEVAGEAEDSPLKESPPQTHSQAKECVEEALIPEPVILQKEKSQQYQKHANSAAVDDEYFNDIIRIPNHYVEPSIVQEQEGENTNAALTVIATTTNDHNGGAVLITEEIEENKVIEQAEDAFKLIAEKLIEHKASLRQLLQGLIFDMSMKAAETTSSKKRENVPHHSQASEVDQQTTMIEVEVVEVDKLFTRLVQTIPDIMLTEAHISAMIHTVGRHINLDEAKDHSSRQSQNVSPDVNEQSQSTSIKQSESLVVFIYHDLEAVLGAYCFKDHIGLPQNSNNFNYDLLDLKSIRAMNRLAYYMKEYGACSITELLPTDKVYEKEIKHHPNSEEGSAKSSNCSKSLQIIEETLKLEFVKKRHFFKLLKDLKLRKTSQTLEHLVDFLSLNSTYTSGLLIKKIDKLILQCLSNEFFKMVGLRKRNRPSSKVDVAPSQTSSQEQEDSRDYRPINLMAALKNLPLESGDVAIVNEYSLSSCDEDDMRNSRGGYSSRS